MDHKESEIPKVFYKKNENFDITYRCVIIEGTKETYFCSKRYGIVEDFS